jgi:K+/H+ antiporter YhaU regulatory subunit KhtT
MGVIVLAIKRGDGMRFNPSPEDPIEPGDHLIVMGERANLDRLEQTAASPR